MPSFSGVQRPEAKFEIALSSITTSGLLAALLGTEWATAVSLLCSTILLFITLFLKEFNLGAKAVQHAETAMKLWKIREDYLSLLCDAQSETVTDKKLRASRD